MTGLRNIVRTAVGAGTVVFLGIFMTALATAQSQGSSAGMTEYVPGASDAQRREMMRVRSQAQKARAEAEQAAIEKSAAEALREQQRQQALADARAHKAIVNQAARELEYATADNAYEEVPAGQIAAWNSLEGRKVQRGVPQEFLDNLPEEETDETKEKKGFKPLKAVTGVFAAAPKLPKFGKSEEEKAKKERGETEPMPEFVPASKLTLSGAAAVAPVEVMEPAPPAAPPAEPQPRVPPANMLVSASTSKPAEVSAPLPPATRRNDDSNVSASLLPSLEDGNEPLMAEGSKKGFMKGITSLLPIGGKGNGASNEELPAFADVGSGAEPEMADKKSNGPGFLGSIADRLTPDFSGSQASSPGRAPEPSSGSDEVYVINTDGVEFFPFGSEEMNSQAVGLPRGTAVRMTKKGDDWSAVQLQNGKVGVLRNSVMRPARGSDDIPQSLFASRSKPAYPTTARISQPRSASAISSGSSGGTSNNYVPPIDVPLPSISTSSDEGALPLGHGLLPPLEESVVE